MGVELRQMEQAAWPGGTVHSLETASIHNGDGIIAGLRGLFIHEAAYCELSDELGCSWLTGLFEETATKA